MLLRRRMPDSQIKKIYEPKIRAVLKDIATACKQAGLESEEPWDMTDEEFEWHVGVYWKDGSRPFCDVSITITQNEVRGDEPDGVNFMLNVVEKGGKILGGVCPYNYSDEIWVSRRDKEAVEARWQEFMDAFDANSVAELFARRP